MALNSSALVGLLVQQGSIYTDVVYYMKQAAEFCDLLLFNSILSLPTYQSGKADSSPLHRWERMV